MSIHALAPRRATQTSATKHNWRRMQGGIDRTCLSCGERAPMADPLPAEDWCWVAIARLADERHAEADALEVAAAADRGKATAATRLYHRQCETVDRLRAEVAWLNKTLDMFRATAVHYIEEEAPEATE